MKLKTLISSSLVLAISLAFISNLSPVQAATYTAPADDSVQDFHIDKEGNISVRQAKVLQVSGTTFYVRYYVGLAFIRMIIKTDKSTKIFRRFGDEIPLSQIKVGETLNIDGTIESGADNISIIASKIVNFSNQKEISSYKGTITSIDLASNNLTLTTKSGPITIALGTTTQIKKGSRTIEPTLVRIGDTVTDVVGIYDHNTKSIDANVMVIFIDKKIFTPRNFEGTLQSIAVGSPTTLIFSTDGKDYTVPLDDKTEILNKARKTVPLKRYLEGDTIRIYGAIRETEEPIIDAEIIRNISL